MLDAQWFHDMVSGRRRGVAADVTRQALWLASVPYAWAVNTRNRRFDRNTSKSKRVSVPVISVGNLTLGGTGKTPMIASLADWLLRQEIKPVIVSRGYKASLDGRNDEAVELSQMLPTVPHIQNPDRVQASTQAIDQYACDIVLLDDGFQHRRLHRDLDIVLVDATCPFENEHLFPRGTLREPIRSLRRAHIIVLTRCDRVEENRRKEIRKTVQAIAPHALWCTASHQATHLVNHSQDQRSLASLANQNVAAFCGIGNPDSFHGLCGDLPDVKVTRFRAYADHAHYDTSQIDDLFHWVNQQPVSSVLCTRKDLVKIRRDSIGESALWAVAVALRLDEGRDAFWLKIAQAAREGGKASAL